MKLKILQVGEAVLRQPARPLSRDEILGERVQQLIGHMRQTMHDAPGVGLAAPQIGEPLQLAVIEDREESMVDVPADLLAECERRPVTFQVVINPTLTVTDESPNLFFEGCLSVTDFVALVPRAQGVRVACLNERGEPSIIEARGWHARILQHEIDHLNGVVYVDRMQPRSLMTVDNYHRYWSDVEIARVSRDLGSA